MSAESLLEALHARGIHFIAGVPDSILKGFCAWVTRDARFDHVIAANEGAALSLAAGHHLATGQMPLVYLQNSGLANALNPYLSMCHPTVYDLPIVLLVGWRGQPGVPDEPQHRKVGAITMELLGLMDIDVLLLKDGSEGSLAKVDHAVASAVAGRSSLAIVVQKGVLDQDDLPNGSRIVSGDLQRGEVIKSLLDHLAHEDVVFSGIGHVSRELYAARLASEGTAPNRQPTPRRDFLCVGGMGHAHQIAIGYARGRRNGRVWCLDGDGALLMHLGALSTISRLSSSFVHVLFDNGVHASVGGQSVSGINIDYGAVAKTLGYPQVFKVSTHAQLELTLRRLRGSTDPAFVWVRVSQQIAEDLPRPKTALVELKHRFWAAGGGMIDDLVTPFSQVPAGFRP